MASVSLGSPAATKAAASASRPPVMGGVPVKLHLASRLGLVSLLLVATTAGLLGYQPSFVTRAVADEPAKNSACVIEANGGQTTCTCVSTEEGKPKDLAATLSATASVLQLVCESTLTFAPDEADKQVCPAETTNLQTCVSNGDSKTSIDVTSLLTGNTEGIKWETVTREAQGTTKKLSIPPANLPYTDQRFAVGCLDSGKTTTKCKLTVTIEARASVTQDQIVTCAYGKTSNQKHQSIKLSPSQNKFTLVCGKDGEVLPTKYQSTFCVRKDGVDARAECSGNYTDVIPAYETQWWKHDAAQHTFTLEIPEGGFPEKETQIMVGCQKSKKDATGTDNEVREEASSESPTVCSVDVTIEAVASSASLSGGVAGVFSWFCSVGAFLTVSCLMM
ncbi:SAG-related sequence SRS38B [Toxoplasma gondii ME49]|uniref:SAG-related sequence SRS38B n=1 Tax=Toxoplasma gondii (strain ATCC 50611 / Me49) TaxID=508771 RepID=S8G790_TOXGM|nr:SAG-related sequence SRS38B [Toxoplasma gondii ME49]EPT27600.1 SAG-related sequence SRS38B [Toxoplasma gondii ME49]|eukprot:XP_002368792.1 SAG-related sequence SRS38B [Toxoplasma gondii ME49]